MLEKRSLFYWTGSNNSGANTVNLDGSLHEKKSSFRMLGLSFFSKLDWGSYIIFIAKTAAQKIGPLILSVRFFSP